MGVTPPHYCHMRVDVKASQWASACGAGVGPHEFCFLAGVERLLSSSVLSCSFALFLVFGWREQAFIGVSYAILIGISRLLASSAQGLRHTRHKDNTEN